MIKYPGGGPHINMVYVYVPAFWGTFSRKIWYNDGGGGGVFIRDEGAQIS